MTTAFVVGLLLDGTLFPVRADVTLESLGFLTTCSTGLLALSARAAGLGMGNLTSATYEHGTTFLLSAGLMNLLLVLDIWDVLSGRKP